MTQMRKMSMTRRIGTSMDQKAIWICGNQLRWLWQKALWMRSEIAKRTCLLLYRRKRRRQKSSCNRSELSNSRRRKWKRSWLQPRIVARGGHLVSKPKKKQRRVTAVSLSSFMTQHTTYICIIYPAINRQKDYSGANTQISLRLHIPHVFGRILTSTVQQAPSSYSHPRRP